MKLLFVGTRSAQSAASLAALLAGSVVPRAVFVYTPNHSRSAGDIRLPPLISAGANIGVLELAAAHGIAASTGSPQQLQALIDVLRPERVLVSCYPHRITTRLLERVPLGWLNIHPSRLPDYRGVNPIFWQLRDGLCEIGVTLQRMNSDYDLGPIIAQSSLGLEDTPDYREISRRVGWLGVRLFLHYLKNPGGAGGGISVPDPQSGSQQPPPGEADFAIDPEWRAEHVVRFVRGVRELGRPFLDTPSQRYLIQDAMVAKAGGKLVSPPEGRLIHCYDGYVALHIL